MLTHYTDAEIKQKLKELVVIADSREQVNGHLISWLDKNHIQHKSRALETGDYSVMLGNTTFEDEIAFERKANLDEIAGNFTVGRERFEREMIRAKAQRDEALSCGGKCYLDGHLPPQLPLPAGAESLFASLMSWQAKYNLTVIFCKPSETAQILYSTLYYWVRDRLKRG